MTATQTQIRRDGDTALNAVTPALAELAYNTTKKRLHIGDGATLGGMPHVNRADHQTNIFNSATATGSANTYAATVVGFAYTTFSAFKLKINVTNTGASTINVNDGTGAMGAKNIYKNVGGTIGAVDAGDLLAGYIYDLIYDGTQFLVLGGVQSGGGVTTQLQVLTSSGNWVKPANHLFSDWELQSASGGGAKGNSSGNVCVPPGSGAYAKSRFDTSVLGSTETITLGAPGAGQTSAGSDGGDGATSSAGALLTCTGGGRGRQSFSSGRGTGGVASGGNILNIDGRSGPSVATGTVNTTAGLDSQLGRGGYGHHGGSDGQGGPPTGYGASPGANIGNSTNGLIGGSPIFISIDYMG